MASSTAPLVVDLDGTLIASDLLHESASTYLLRSPWTSYRLLTWLRRGKTHLKLELEKTAALEPEILPYRPDVLGWLREERATGRRLVLASASPLTATTAIADHLGIFDEVLGTEGAVNLRAREKRDLLVAKYGDHNYDYVGNHSDDVIVWESARTAHVVGSPQFVERVRRVARVGHTFPGSTTDRLRAAVEALRLHQWAKNLLILVPVFTAHRLDEPSAVGLALLAFLTFGLVASSVYVLNDLVDIAHDRHHVKKRNRPFASGRLSLTVGWLMWPSLAVAGFGLAALFLPLLYVAVLVGYLALTMLYSFALKRRPVVDVVLLAALYTTRLVAGAAAVAITLSMWLLTFSMFFFLSLALVKRVSELASARRRGTVPKGRGYQLADLELLSSFGVSTGVASIIVLALYVEHPATAALYRTPEILWLSVPVMLVWILRVWLLAHRGQMDEDPILFAVRDRASLLGGLLVGAIFVAAQVIQR